MAGKRTRPAPEPHDPPDKAGASPLDVTLPPIDATPEEIAQALVRRPLFQRPKGKEPEDDQGKG